RSIRMRSFSVRCAAALLAAGMAGITLAQTTITGPSSSQSPYLLPTYPGVISKSLFTTGDSVNNKPDGTPYRMVGIPDGLGAFDNGNGTYTLLMNHELGNTSGMTRAHGFNGAFVSRWTINTSTGAVLFGQDQIQN